MKSVLPLKNIETICSNKENTELFLKLLHDLLPHRYKIENCNKGYRDT